MTSLLPSSLRPSRFSFVSLLDSTGDPDQHEEEEEVFLSEFLPAVYEVCEDIGHSLSLPLTWLPNGYRPADVSAALFTTSASQPAATTTASGECSDVLERTSLLEELQTLRDAVKANLPLGLALVLCPTPAPAAHVVVSGLALNPSVVLLGSATYLIGTACLYWIRSDLQATGDNLLEAEQFNRLSASLVVGGLGAAQVAIALLNLQAPLSWCLHPVPAALFALDAVVGPAVVCSLGYMLWGWSFKDTRKGMAYCAGNGVLLAIAYSGVPSIFLSGAVLTGSLVCTAMLNENLSQMWRDRNAMPSLEVALSLKKASDLMGCSRYFILAVSSSLLAGVSLPSETSLVMLVVLSQGFGNAGAIHLLLRDPAGVVAASTAVVKRRQEAARGT
eukprot:TRINITY_DN36528_c0_g1_i1.p1 TRINITY_DN36528_c0_g1~~TRINITY_DN36528_c0_g1_i1.p1  ORF type:complete len:389 (-),score=50.03 TRINITY_DN36528_c0_g1_i1:47-1213(-)